MNVWDPRSGAYHGAHKLQGGEHCHVVLSIGRRIFEQRKASCCPYMEVATKAGSYKHSYHLTCMPPSDLIKPDPASYVILSHGHLRRVCSDQTSPRRERAHTTP